ncbi:formate dehydrogenase accessory sulfurtransferase FdhD [Roseibium sp. M-1]
MIVQTAGESRALAQRSGNMAEIVRVLPEEIPVALVFDGSTAAVMMATPADIEDFAIGFSLTEGIVRAREEIRAIECIDQEHGIEARVWLWPDRSDVLAKRRRNAAGPVGCGLCGIESLAQAIRPLPRNDQFQQLLSFGEIRQADEALRERQPLHQRTRATHAAGFLHAGAGILATREDVGRHNALDKLVGALEGAAIDPGEGAILMTSRVSVELVQKCAMVGCPCLVAVSAPTLHALRLAEDAGITIAVAGRNRALEVFTHPERIFDEGRDWRGNPVRRSGTFPMEAVRHD